MNPVLWRELRVTARTPRVSLLISGALWLCVAMVAVVSQGVSTLVAGHGGASQVGSVLVGVLLVTLSGMIALAAPLLAARALMLERRRRTFDVLIITPLTARDILRGKLVGALMPLFLVLGATLPLAMILRMYGGFTAFRVLYCYVFLAMQTLLFGLLGLAAAILTRQRRRRGMALLLAALLFILVGTPVVDLGLTGGYWNWIKIPLVGGFALWIVADTTRRLVRGSLDMGDVSSEIWRAALFLLLSLLIILLLAWDVANGGPNLRYFNPILALSWLTGVPVGVPPAPFNFLVTFSLYLLIPGAVFPVLATRLQRYINTSYPHERGLFF